MSIYLWCLALAFFIEENSYFGWNMLPHSDAELIADGIGLILFSLAIRN